MLLDEAPQIGAETLLELASSGIPDADLLVQANTSIDSIAMRSSVNRLKAESKERQRATWNSFNEVQKQLYTDSGYVVPAKDKQNWFAKAAGSVGDFWDTSGLDSAWSYTGGWLARSTAKTVTEVFSGLWWALDNSVNRLYRATIDNSGNNTVKRIESAAERVRSDMESDGYQLTDDEWKYVKWKYAEVNKIQRVDYGDPNSGNAQGNVTGAALVSGIPFFGQAIQAANQTGVGNDILSNIPILNNYLIRETNENPFSKDVDKGAQVKDEIWQQYNNRLEAALETEEYEIGPWASWNRTWNGHSWIDPAVSVEVQNNLRSAGFSGEAFDFAAYLARGRNVDEWLQETEGIATDDPRYAERRQVLATNIGNKDFSQAVGDLKSDQSKLSWGRGFAQAAGIPKNTAAYTFVSGGMDAAVALLADPTLIAGKAFKMGRVAQKAVSALNLPALRRLSKVVATNDEAARSIGGASALIDEANEVIKFTDHTYQVYNSVGDIDNYNNSYRLFSTILKNNATKIGGETVDATVLNIVSDNFETIFGSSLDNVDDLDVVFRTVDEAGKAQNIDFFDTAYEFLVKTEKDLIAHGAEKGYSNATGQFMRSLSELIAANKRIPYGAFDLTSANRFTDWMRVRQVRRYNNVIDRIIVGMTEINQNIEGAALRLMNDLPWGRNMVDDLIAENTRLLPEGGLTNYDAVWNFYEAKFVEFGVSNQVGMAVRGFGNGIMVPEKWRLFSTAGSDLTRINRPKITGVDVTRRTRSQFGRLPESGDFGFVWRAGVNKSEGAIETIKRLKNINTSKAAQGPLSLSEKVIGGTVRLVSKPARIAAAATWNLTHHVPKSLAMSLTGREAVAEFEKLIGYGSFADMPKSVRDNYLDRFLRGADTNQAWFGYAGSDEDLVKAVAEINKIIAKEANTGNALFDDVAEWVNNFSTGNKLDPEVSWAFYRQTFNDLMGTYGDDIYDEATDAGKIFSKFRNFQYYNPSANSMASRMYIERQFLQDIFSRLGIDATKQGKEEVNRFINQLTHYRYAPNNADVIGLGESAMRVALLPVAQHSTQVAIPSVRELWRASKHTGMLSKSISRTFNGNFVEAFMGTFWKPATLMRLGFIPRAAGEEYLAFFAREGIWGPLTNVATYTAKDTKGIFLGLPAKISEWTSNRWGAIGDAELGEEAWGLVQALQYKNVNDYIVNLNKMVMAATGQELKQVDYLAASANYWTARTIKKLRGFSFNRLPEEMKRSIIVRMKAEGKEDLVSKMGFDDLYDAAVNLEGASAAMSRSAWFQQMMAQNQADLGRTVAAVPYDDIPTGQRISIRKDGYDPGSGTEIELRAGHEWIEISAEDLKKATAEDLSYYYGLQASDPVLRPAYDEVAGKLTETQVRAGIAPLLDNSAWAPETVLVDQLPLYPGVDFDAVEPVHDKFNLLANPTSNDYDAPLDVIDEIVKTATEETTTTYTDTFSRIFDHIGVTEDNATIGFAPYTSSKNLNLVDQLSSLDLSVDNLKTILSKKGERVVSQARSYPSNVRELSQATESFLDDLTKPVESYVQNIKKLVGEDDPAKVLSSTELAYYNALDSLLTVDGVAVRLDHAVVRKDPQIFIEELKNIVDQKIPAPDGAVSFDEILQTVESANLPEAVWPGVASWGSAEIDNWVSEISSQVLTNRANILSATGSEMVARALRLGSDYQIGLTDNLKQIVNDGLRESKSFDNAIFNLLDANENNIDDLVAELLVSPQPFIDNFNQSVQYLTDPEVAKLFVVQWDEATGNLDVPDFDAKLQALLEKTNKDDIDLNFFLSPDDVNEIPMDLFYEVSAAVENGQRAEDVLQNYIQMQMQDRLNKINTAVDNVNNVINDAAVAVRESGTRRASAEGIQTSRKSLTPEQTFDLNDPQLILPKDGSKLYRGINSDNQWFVDEFGNLHLRANRWGRNTGEAISTSTDPAFSINWLGKGNSNSVADASLLVEIDQPSIKHLVRGEGADLNEIELISVAGETVIPAGAWRVSTGRPEGLDRFVIGRESVVADLERVASGQVDPNSSYFWRPENLQPNQLEYLNRVQQRGYAQYPPRPPDAAQIKVQNTENVVTKVNELREYVQTWSQEDLDLLYRHLQNDQMLGFASPVEIADTLDSLGVPLTDLPPQMQALLDRLPPGSAFGDLLLSALKKNADGDDRMLEALNIITNADRRIGQVITSDAAISVLDKTTLRESLKTVISRSLNDPNYAYWVQRNQRTLVGSRTNRMTLNPIADNTENLYTVMVDKQFISEFRTLVNSSENGISGVDLILNDLRARGMTPKEEEQLRALFQGIQDKVVNESVRYADAFSNATLVPLSTIAYRDANDAIRLQELLSSWRPGSGQVNRGIDLERTVRVGSINTPIGDAGVIDSAFDRFVATIDNDAYFNRFTPLDSTTQLPDQIRGAANASATSLQSNMDEYADVLTDVFMDSMYSRDGQIMHEIVAPSRRGTFGVDVMTGIEASDLPASLYAPKKYAVPTNILTDITRWGFGTVINPAIFAIVRNPMYHLAFMRGYEFARANSVHMRNSLLDDFAEQIVRDTGLDLNELRNAWSMIDYQTSRTLSTADDFSDELAALLDDGKISPNSVLASEAISQDDLQNLMDWVRMDNNIEMKNVEIAALRAYDDMVPYIDDHSVRSFAQEYVRNIFPFLFAQEQFLKRWARSFMYSPEAFRRAQLVAYGATHNGFVHEDSYGNKFFTIPGTETLNSILENIPVVNSLFNGAVHFPTEVPLSLNTRNVLPGIPSDLENLPSVGPVVMIGLQPVLEHFPEMKELASAFQAGRPINTQQSIAEMIIPKNYLRIWTSIFGETIGTTNGLASELNRACINAVQQMEAEAVRLRFEQLDLRKAGKEEEAKLLQDKIDTLSMPSRATPEAIDKYLDSVKQWARANMLVRGFLGLLAPTTPTNVFENEELSSDFTALLDHMEFDEALTVFLTEHPEGGAFSIFESSKNTKAPLPRTTESLRWMQKNRDWLEVTPLAAPWLMPQADGSDDLSQQAFEDMKAVELRFNKDLDEWYDDFKFAAGANVYFPEKTRFDIAIENTTDSKERTALRQEWQLRSLAIRNQHPTFAKQLESRITSDAERTIRELDLFLNLPEEDLPDVEHIDDLRVAVASWKSYKNSYDSLAGNNTKAAREQREELRRSFILYGYDFVVDYPNMRSFWNSVVLPSLELTSKSAALEQIGN